MVGIGDNCNEIYNKRRITLLIGDMDYQGLSDKLATNSKPPDDQLTSILTNATDRQFKVTVKAVLGHLIGIGNLISLKEKQKFFMGGSRTLFYPLKLSSHATIHSSFLFHF